MDLRVSAISLNPLRSATTYGTQAVGLRPQRPPKDGQDPMTPVAKALGLSTHDVKAQLRSGKSLNDLADAAGLAHDDLIAAIRAGLPSDAMSRRSPTSATGLAAAAASTTATAATNAAARIPTSATTGAIDAATDTTTDTTTATGAGGTTGTTAATGATGVRATAGATDPTAIAGRVAATKSRPSSTGNGRGVIGDPAKLSQLSGLFNVDDGRLNSASSAKELVDLLQQNGADLSQLKNVLKSGDLLNTTA
jgi:hypothetical protein